MNKGSHPMMYARTPSWIRRHTTPTLLFLTSTWRGVSYSKKKSERALVIWLFIFSHGLTRGEEGLSLSSPHWHINTRTTTGPTAVAASSPLAKGPQPSLVSEV